LNDCLRLETIIKYMSHIKKAGRYNLQRLKISDNKTVGGLQN